MRTSPNTLLWKFMDAVTPAVWQSKQAKRFYEAAVAAERAGKWPDYAVGGSVRGVSNKTHVPQLQEPQFGTSTPDAAIESMMIQHIAAVRRHANTMENVLAAYGPSAYRKRVAQMRAPAHPFDAEAEILALLRAGFDEISVHGVRFARDASGAFVEQQPQSAE